MIDWYFAEDDRMTIFTDMGDITRHNDMGDILAPFPARFDYEEDNQDAENV